MKFVRRQLAVVLIPAFAIFILNFAMVIALASHGHALQFIVEHGVDHLLLIHDPYSTPNTENQISDLGHEDHEFHMPAVNALVKKKLETISIVSYFNSNLECNIWDHVYVTIHSNPQFPAHSRGKPLSVVLRI